MSADTVHGCALALGSFGILIRGPARAGKSALCLSALRAGEAAGLESRLVADDRVAIGRDDDGLILSPPQALAGLIEISGVGLMRLPYRAQTRLDLVVDLATPDEIERLPEVSQHRVRLQSQSVARIVLPRRSAAFGADVLVTLALSGHPPLHALVCDRE